MFKVVPLIQNLFNDFKEVGKEYESDEQFIAWRCDRPNQSFSMGKNIFARYFLVLRPTNDESPKPSWIARAAIDYNCNPKYTSYLIM